MKLYFCVAEQYYSVEFTDDKAPYRSLLNSSAPFYQKEVPEKLCFELVVGDQLVSSGEPNGKFIGKFENGEIQHQVWHKDGGGYWIHVQDSSGVVYAALETTACFDRCKASLFGTADQQHTGLNNVMMIVFAFAAAHHHVILIHASVPMVDGKAYPFQGKSGTGKSTHSQLWLQHIPNAELLNDDNPAIRVADDGAVFVYGTPWSGKTPCYRNVRAILGGLLRLEQAPVNDIYRQPVLEAFTSLLSSCSTMVWDRPSYYAICDTVSKVVGKAPSFYFKNRPVEESARLSFAHLTADE